LDTGELEEEDKSQDYYFNTQDKNGMPKTIQHLNNGLEEIN
jgi:hypothetical protein